MLRVNVTGHALDRYRHRIATYADAPDSELADRVANAVFVKDDEPTPFPKIGGFRYSRDSKNRNIYYVLDPITQEFVNLVTVLDCEPSVLPKAMNRQRQAVSEGHPERFPIPDSTEPDPSTPIYERRGYWKAIAAESHMMMNLLIRSHPDHSAWVRLHAAANLKMSECRQEWRAYKIKFHRDHDSIIDDNGQIKQLQAIKYLLQQNAEILSQIEQLKRRLGVV